MPNLAEVEEICRSAMLGGANDEAVTDLLQTHTERRIGAVATEDVGIIQRYGWASPSVLSALGFRRLPAARRYSQAGSTGELGAGGTTWSPGRTQGMPA